MIPTNKISAHAHPPASSGESIAWSHLRQSAWLNALPHNAADIVLDACRPLKLATGALLHAKGEPCNGLFGIERGEIQVGAVNTEGEELIMTRLGAGNWFGEIAVIDQGPRTHDAYAASDCELAWLELAALQRLHQQQPQLHHWLALLLCQHVRESFNAIDQFLLLNPRQRLAHRLLQLSQSTEADAAEGIHMKQEALGALVGLSRQSINRILQHWQGQGWLRIGYGRLIILDPVSMQAYVQGTLEPIS